MHISLNQCMPAWIFTPTNEEEEKFLNLINPKTELRYNGMIRDSNHPKNISLKFIVNGTWGTHREVVDGVQVKKSGFSGGMQLIVNGESLDDKKNIASIRDICYFKTGGIIFISSHDTEKKKSYLLCGNFCSQCSSPLIDLVSCGKTTCDDCAKKCNHQYEKMPVHGDGIILAVGECCEKCGRIRPGTEPDKNISQKAHIARACREFGFIFLGKV